MGVQGGGEHAVPSQINTNPEIHYQKPNTHTHTHIYHTHYFSLYFPYYLICFFLHPSSTRRHVGLAQVLVYKIKTH